MQRARFGLLLALVVVALQPLPTEAQGSWLDGPPVNWNAPGRALPAPPPERGENPRCGADRRPPETPEDNAVAGAGWILGLAYQAGWGIKVVWAQSGYDGMCRPMGYQAFVFAEGQFAGTVSPTPMDSRTDGAMSEVHFYNPELISARFLRYAPTDALCCPSLPAVTVSYRVERPAGDPLLVPFHSTVEDPR